MAPPSRRARRSLKPAACRRFRSRLDQSSCNKDFSCLKGFCPSFVTVHGATLKKGKAIAEAGGLPPLPEPARPVELQQGFQLPQRLLPLLRDRAWRHPQEGQGDR